MQLAYQNLEIEQIYHQVFHADKLALTVCAANEQEGVTSLALALAQRHTLAGYRTLVVDLNLYRPSIHAVDPAQKSSTTGLVDDAGFQPPSLITSEHLDGVLLGVPAPQQRVHIMALRHGQGLAQQLQQWLTQVDCVIFDTSPINQINQHNIPAEHVAAISDGAILMVMAGKTSQAMLSNAMGKLDKAKAKLLGCVYNDAQNPRLAYELLRQTNKAGRWLGPLSVAIKKGISNSRLLKVEV
ncbi:tyrosine-protein kinase family protein [Motilimonas pumila]|uniref:Tyrosine-protein kinase family protein n=1 Tax=Motilimonas pumila TaxID=2303987 RepID=A0A418YD61_9GAMM|nr:tyrosine-protein kinase family protein [Motilimonas pumila]RJG42460.1 tyrosine-protein kinase family protein [Motilimonas pumila]